MTSTDKKRSAEELAAKGRSLVTKAETILQGVILRNARLSQEMKQVRSELETKLATQTEL